MTSIFQILSRFGSNIKKNTHQHNFRLYTNYIGHSYTCEYGSLWFTYGSGGRGSSTNFVTVVNDLNDDDNYFQRDVTGSFYPWKAGIDCIGNNNLPGFEGVSYTYGNAPTYTATSAVSGVSITPGQGIGRLQSWTGVLSASSGTTISGVASVMMSGMSLSASSSSSPALGQYYYDAAAKTITIKSVTGNITVVPLAKKSAAQIEETGTFYDTLDEALNAAAAGQTVEINDESITQAAQLKDGVTLKDVSADGTGTRYKAVGDASVQVTNGKVSGVLSGTVEVDPEDGTSAELKVKGKDGSEHDVTVGSEGAIVSVATGEDGTVSSTVTPTDPAKGVTIDGVTYSGKESYDVDDPMSGEGVTATVPDGKSVSVPGSDGDSFTVTNPADTGDDGIAVNAPGAGGGKADVVVPQAGGKVTVSTGADDVPGTQFTAEADNTTLALKSETGEDGTVKDYVELESGAVDVPQSGKVTVNGKEVENKGAGDVSVSKNADGSADVKIPAGTTAVVGGVEYTGEVTVSMDAEGNIAFGKGEVTLKSRDGGDGDRVDVKVGGSSVHVQNKYDGAGRDITVKVPVSETNANGQASVPAGGKVEIGTSTYTVPETAAEGTVFEIGPAGAILESGAAGIGDGGKLGFGSVTFGNGGADADETSDVTVEVVTPADGMGSGKARVTVPAGETFTVTGADGKEHTYTNNGAEALELEVDENGSVTVKDLPGEGLVLGPDTPVTVTDADGSNPNPLTAGENGATLKDNTRGEGNSNNPPLLDSGSVILPDSGGRVNVKDPTATQEPTEKRLEGKNVEVSADSTSVKSTGRRADGFDGEVTVENGTRYYVPDGQTSTMENGTFKSPAKGMITDSKDGPGSHPYVLVPDSEANESNGKYLFSDDAAEGANSSVFAEPGAAFDVRVKEDKASTDKNQLEEGSFGHYEGAGERGANVLVNHDEGTVTLTGGSLNVSGEGKDGVMPSVKVGDHKIETDGESTINVTATDDSGDGKPDSADVTVPAGGKVTIDGKTYENAGAGDLTLHMDENGDVSVKEGTVKLGEGDVAGFGDTTITGSDNSDGTPAVTVTVPASDGSENAGVEASGSGKVTVGGTDVYTAGEAGATLEVTPEGEVELKAGSVTLPTPESDTATVKVAAGEGESAKEYDVSGDGVTVSKDAAAGNAAARTQPGGSVAVTDETGKSTEYTAPEGSTAEVELTEKGPSLKSGAVELDKGESIGVNGAAVENSGDAALPRYNRANGEARTQIAEEVRRELNKL